MRLKFLRLFNEFRALERDFAYADKKKEEYWQGWLECDFLRRETDATIADLRSRLTRKKKPVSV